MPENIAVVNFAIVTGLLGLVPLFSPRNFGLWKISDCFVHIFLILNLAYLWRFYLSLTKSPREKLIFWTFLVIGQIFTLIDFIYPKTPYLANPGVIIWNNIPVVGIGIGVFITLGSLPLAFYFFFRRENKRIFSKNSTFPLYNIFCGIWFGRSVYNYFSASSYCSLWGFAYTDRSLGDVICFLA